MSFFDSLKQSVKNHFEKNKIQKEEMDRIIRENEIIAAKTFADEFRINQKKVLVDQAKRDAARLSGIEKIRAQNRLRNLNRQENPNSKFSKLREYTQKNLANREQKLKETAEKRQASEKLRKERFFKQKQGREQKIQNKKPFGY